METVIIALFCMALILFGALTLSQVSLSSTDEIATAWRQMESISGEIARTNITALGAETQSSGSIVEVTLQNAGETKLKDFKRWDVILQYHALGSNQRLVKRLTFTDSTLVADRWSVKGIYQNAEASDPEVFDLGIFNPDEEMVIQMRVNPAVESGTTTQATVVTLNGVSASALFAGT